MINCVANKIEQTAVKTRRLGKKIFDIKELNAQAYHRQTENSDIFTVLDKNYNKLLVQNVKSKSATEQESVTQFFAENGQRTISIKSTITNVGN